MQSKSSILERPYEARTAYSKPIRIHCPSGDNTKEPVYAYDVNKRGERILVQVGTENRYELIQSHYEETRIENILARLQNGDTSVIRGQGTYADISEMPNNINDMYRERIKAENYWRTLPKEIRAEFGHSFDRWITEAGQEAWAQKMGIGVKEAPEANDLVPEVKPEVPKTSTPEPTGDTK